MKWQSVDDIIERILRKTGGPKKDKIEKIWNSMEESRHASIETFKRGELILKVKNSAYLQILSFKRSEIIEKLNSELTEKVRNIRIRLGG